MEHGIRTTTNRPSPFAALQIGAVINLDNYGSIWGTDTIEKTDTMIAEARTEGVAIDEWDTTDLDGHPLRIVRVVHPKFGTDIRVFATVGSTAVPA